MPNEAISLVILGAGGNSLAIIDAVEAINAAAPGAPRYRIHGILDDLDHNQHSKVLGYPVLGKIDTAGRHRDNRFINGISSVDSFRKIPAIIQRTGLPRESFETIIHPAATISRSASIGRGTAIMAGSIICAEAHVGDHVILLQSTTINHHSRVGDHCTLSSGISVLGYVDIGANAFIGGGSSIMPRSKVGAGALVGMGSVVIRDVAAGNVVVGNPARVLARSGYSASA